MYINMCIYIYMSFSKGTTVKKRATKVVPKRIQQSGFDLCIIFYPSDSFGPFLLDLLKMFDGDDLPSPMVQSLKNQPPKKNKSQFLEVP